MGKNDRIEVCTDLTGCLEDIRIRVANDMKMKYGLSEVTVPRTISSQILASKLKREGALSFKIRKVGINKGILELL